SRCDSCGGGGGGFRSTPRGWASWGGEGSTVVLDRGFFFQAEDGIRDATVTGVQTCALPICRRGAARVLDQLRDGGGHVGGETFQIGRASCRERGGTRDGADREQGDERSEPDRGGVRGVRDCSDDVLHAVQSQHRQSGESRRG